MRWFLLGLSLLLAAPAAAEGRWDTDPKTGCKIWNGNPREGHQSHWSGKCVDGFASGRGVASWTDEGADGAVVSYYVGEVREGRRHGKGSYFFPNGDKYYGEYRNNLPHGFGIYASHDGSRYEGKYREGKMHGVGVRVWPDGAWYEGPFVNDMMHGRGVFQYPNGNRYEGPFEHGQMQGVGTAFYVDGNRYKGPFKDGKQDGVGSCLRQDNTWGQCEWLAGTFVRWLE